MKPEDVLHLYLGQKIEWFPLEYGVIKGISKNALLIDFAAATKYISPGECRLILRRLSDVTDDELKEMFTIVFKRPFPNSGKIYHYPKKDKELDRKLLWSGLDRFAFDVSGDHWADCDLSVKKYNQHAITLYLLSKGFWLWDDSAFDEGLIIDAKTVK